MDEDLKAIYSVIVYWWGFIKDKYPTGMTDNEIQNWIKQTDIKSKEIKKDDSGLAWLYRKIGIDVCDFITRKQAERQGKEVEW